MTPIPIRASAGGFAASQIGEPSAEATRASDEVPLILIVDDDPQVRLLAGACLAKSGFRIGEAQDSETAMEAFRTLRPSLVLCDVVMPGVDGYELCGMLRAAEGGSHVPIVMMTALEDVDSIERAFAVGATEFCIKPLNWTLLPRHLRFILKASQAQEALRVSEERYALAAQGANDGLWDWDIAGAHTYYSERWSELLELEPREVEPDIEAWLTRVHPEDRLRVRAELKAHLEARTKRFESEHRIRNANGKPLWMLVRGVAVRDQDGTPLRMAGWMTDITARKEAVDRLEHNALHDSLTGLPNRVLLMDRLQHCIQRMQRHPEESFGVLFIDLDRFKVVNDSLGHFVGDRLLVEVAERLSSLLRSGETLARFGGDEFAVLMEDLDGELDSLRVAERIQTALRQPTVINGHSIVAMASIGVAMSSERYTTPDEMLRDADVAMYAAKAKGPGHSEMFEANMHVRAVHSLELERELRTALGSSQISLDYQPIVCLESGQISGFEALVRWDHPQRGRLRPDMFLDIALDTGLIVPMGRRVIELACKQMAMWRRDWSCLQSAFIGINLCPQELLQPDLLDVVKASLESSGLDPDCLGIEVTERSLIQNMEDARNVMRTLRELGIRLSVDDFGTGFSSFAYLDRLPFDVLKIDRSFVTQAETTTRKARIIQSIVGVGHDLGLKVVAEGVEDLALVSRLAELHCEYAQGNGLCPALPAAQIEQLLGDTNGSINITATGSELAAHSQ